MVGNTTAVFRPLPKTAAELFRAISGDEGVGLVDVVVQRTACSKPHVVHIDKIKPFLGEAPRRQLVDGTEPTPSEEEAPAKSESNQESSRDFSLQSPASNGDEWPAESERVQDEKHEDAPNLVFPAVPVDQSTSRARDASPDLCTARLENAIFRHAARREYKPDDRLVRGVDEYSHRFPGWS